MSTIIFAGAFIFVLGMLAGSLLTPWYDKMLKDIEYSDAVIKEIKDREKRALRKSLESFSDNKKSGRARIRNLLDVCKN